MKKYFFLTLILCSCIIYSCNWNIIDNETNEETTYSETVTISKSTTLFNKESNSNEYVFETNDEKYITPSGYTLWTTTKTNNAQAFETITTKTCKQSGTNEAGYGIIFCEQQIEDNHFMLTVLINTRGFYTIGKVTNGTFIHINKGWKSSNNLNKGYGIYNQLEVTHNSNTNTFTLFINGCETATFTIEEKILFKDSNSGYVVVIADNEQFPEVPVKVLFE